MGILSTVYHLLPNGIRDIAKSAYRNFVPAAEEPLMYRTHLFQELLNLSGEDSFADKRILEIGPRDGLDSLRLSSLKPEELVMIDLPEKQSVTASWLPEIACPHRYIEANFMYMPEAEIKSLGSFDLIWCTGVLYHNAEQMRFLRKLFKLLRGGGYLVLESATLRSPWWLRKGNYVQIHYPNTYRNTGTITHFPTALAIKSWLRMVGFEDLHDSDCFNHEDKGIRHQRMACIAKKISESDGDVYYGKSGLNPKYLFGDSI